VAAPVAAPGEDLREIVISKHIINAALVDASHDFNDSRANKTTGDFDEDDNEDEDQEGGARLAGGAADDTQLFNKLWNKVKDIGVNYDFSANNSIQDEYAAIDTLLNFKQGRVGTD
jgi:hypothetical protein